MTQALLEIKKRGSQTRLPRHFDDLERQSQTELDLTHGASTFDIGDLSIVATLAVNATVGSVVCTEGKHWMIEDIEGIHDEFRPHALSDSKGFRH